MAIKQENSLKAKLANSLSPYYRVLFSTMKLNQLIIATCVAIATITTAAAPSIAYDAKIVGQDYGSAVNMRSGPGKGYRVLDTTSVGNRINVVDCVQGDDGYSWYKVESGGTTGWVRSDFIGGLRTGGC